MREHPLVLGAKRHGVPLHAAHLGGSTSTPSLAIVANRLPADISEAATRRRCAGGLVSALSSIATDGTRWFGYAGAEAGGGPLDHDGLRIHPVLVDGSEFEQYYEGFSNSVLWPLFHGRLRPVEFDRSWWQAYRSVNSKFAAAVAEATPLGGTVWVHDYHLLLAPSLIRSLRPDLRVGLFLHIPFPCAGIFSTLPWRQEIVEGMLGADLIGFQLPEDVDNFVAVAGRLADVEINPGRLELPSREVLIDAFPISIDFALWNELGERATLRAASHRRAVGGDTIFLGVDRLDYTKGISQRLEAFGELLDEGRLDPESCTFVQIGAPTRCDIPAYRTEHEAIETTIARINKRHRRENGSMPIVFMQASLDPVDLAGWYRAADVLVVTSLADGMNLVVKEFVATRGSSTASVILSEFAGAAAGLHAALIVNPYDIEAIKGAMLHSLGMPDVARRERMRAMCGCGPAERCPPLGATVPRSVACRSGRHRIRCRGRRHPAHRNPVETVPLIRCRSTTRPARRRHGRSRQWTVRGRGDLTYSFPTGRLELAQLPECSRLAGSRP